jgi:crotonobetainyl-CoA:carnitine CoA-transferase CaiB-like acyl-CoA transferase
VPAQNFATRDGWVSVFVGNDRQWHHLTQALDDARLLDPGYTTNAARTRNREAVLALVAENLAVMSMAEATDRLVAWGVACSPVYTVAEALNCEPARDRGLVQEANHARYGRYRHASGPIPALGGDGAVGAPTLGEHSEAILHELGYDQMRIDALLAGGAIANSPNPETVT